MTQKEALIQLEESLRNMNSTTMGRRMFLASSGLLLAACATEQHRQREGNLSGNETDLTVADEKKLTQEVLPQMRKDYPAFQNAEVQNYVKNLGAKIAKASQLEGQPYNYNFTAVNVGYVNAFALPAGTVFVTLPLIAMAESEAELAGVIGHEIGHIKARHTAIRMSTAKKEESKSGLFAAGGALLGGALGYGVSQLLCKPSDQECIKKSVAYGAAAGAMGGLLVQKYKFMANSREDEMEADRIGFRTSVMAQYDKEHSGLFYEKLLKMEQASKAQQENGLMKSLADAMSTHPPSQERVNQMKQMAAETKQNSKAIVSTIQFDRIRKICSEAAKELAQKQKS